MDRLAEILNTVVYDNTVERWLFALGIAVAAYVTLRILNRLVRAWLAKVVKRTDTAWDDIVIGALQQTKGWFLLVISIFAGSVYLTLPEIVPRVLSAAALIGLLVQGGIWLNSGITGYCKAFASREAEADGATITTVNALGFVARIIVWALVVLLALDNVGVDVTALVAGLGIGGVAIALALQNVLGDLFASMSIVLDKPFVVGDFLTVGDLSGTVEHVGLKTTRVKSLTGEQLVFSNADLLSSRIRNYGRMAERRILFALGVTYQTPRATLEKIPALLREAVEAQEKARFDRSHFKEYGDSALVFETVYYVREPDYATYMDAQQAINLRIHGSFEAEGIEFAYPTQTLFIEKNAA